MKRYAWLFCFLFLQGILATSLSAQGVSRATIIDYQGVTAANAGCPPSGIARSYYDPSTNSFKVVDSTCTGISGNPNLPSQAQPLALAQIAISPFCNWKRATPAPLPFIHSAPDLSIASSSK